MCTLSWLAASFPLSLVELLIEFYTNSLLRWLRSGFLSNAQGKHHMHGLQLIIIEPFFEPRWPKRRPFNQGRRLRGDYGGRSEGVYSI